MLNEFLSFIFAWVTFMDVAIAPELPRAPEYAETQSAS